MRITAYRVALFLILLAGCSGPTSPDAMNPSALLGRTWVLASMTDRDGHDEEIPYWRVTLSFSDSLAMSGTGPVNRYNGRYLAGTNGSLTFEHLTTTAVAGPGVDLEESYLSALADVRRFQVTGGQLSLSFGTAGMLLFHEEK